MIAPVATLSATTLPRNANGKTVFGGWRPAISSSFEVTPT